MADTENTKQNIVCIAPGYSKKNRTRTTSIYELFGHIAETQLETPLTLDDAKRIRNEAFSGDAGNDLTLAVTQAKALHDLLSFYPDESEASGNGERAHELRWHEARYGRLPWGVVYYLLRHALSGSYKKISKRDGKANSEKHPARLDETNFIEWLTTHKNNGAAPKNLAEIKALDGFKKWGTDQTLRGWYKKAGLQPPLKNGRPPKK